MNTCGYCQKAKQMLANEIANNEIVVEPASSAPAGVSGFPTFIYNGKMHSGLPQSKQQLYTKLGYSVEGYHHKGSGYDYIGVI